MTSRPAGIAVTVYPSWASDREAAVTVPAVLDAVAAAEEADVGFPAELALLAGALASGLESLEEQPVRASEPASSRQPSAAARRRPTARLELVCLDSVGCQSHGRLHGKFRGHMAGVICNRHALICSALLYNVVGKALGGTSHHINIHPVNAGADNTSQSCCSELQVHIKTLFNLIFVTFNGAKLCFCVLIKIGV